ncbi:MAG: hypothetical protein SOV80_03865 [Bacilli bacterium]|nr:hypothetical protein [bacterium]MDY2697347.1 hypothetical protein [Bacilli bacterium]
MIIEYNYKNYYINKIYLFKDGQIVLSFQDKISITKQRIDNSIYKCNLYIANIMIEDLKKKNKLDLKVNYNFIYQTESRYDLYIYLDDKKIKIEKLEDTKEEMREGYFYIYENYKITFLNDYKFTAKMPELKFYKNENDKNNLKTIESLKNECINASMKKALEEKQKDFCYYALEDQYININDFFIKPFLKVEKTNDYINFDNFKKELEKFLSVNYIDSHQLKKFLKFYNIDYNKKFMN